jgi:hypothetical protein
MPNVLTENGFTFVIYYNDHRPAHVHVYKSGLVIINLNNRRTVPTFRDVRGMSDKDVRDAVAIATANKRFLVSEWRRIHAQRNT